MDKFIALAVRVKKRKYVRKSQSNKVGLSFLKSCFLALAG
jgi:hypothetical protein